MICVLLGSGKAIDSSPVVSSVIGKELIGESEVMNTIFFKIEKIAPTDANILILGENGTGKSVLLNSIRDRNNEYSIFVYEEENESISKYEWLYDVLDSLKLLKIMQEV